jgi:NhaP-type Na+/H+ or K+/H+ antiporter
LEILDLALVALAVLGFGLISGRVQESVITAPMVFVAFGFLLGPGAAGLLRAQVGEGFFHGLAELTLVLVLFTDAARIDLRLLRREHDLPVRLLAIGLPLTMLLGAILAAAMFGTLGWWAAALIAAILAPTDAALGQAVVASPKVPVRVRQALNVESGLNDGIALPVVMILLSCAGAAAELAGGPAVWARFAALQVVLGPLVGVAVGFFGGKLVELGQRSGWMNHTFQQLAALALALIAFAGAETVHGNGFIAAFVAGLTLGNVSRAVCACLFEFGEAEGQLLALLTFLLFGAVMVPDALGQIDGRVLLYALLSLTVIRMVPAALALWGTGLRWQSVVFLGWFGPRGIASILFLLLVVAGSGLPGAAEINAVVVTTVLLSVFAHGLTAWPASIWYARCARDDMARDAAEHRPVTEMPVRLPHPGVTMS